MSLKEKSLNNSILATYQNHFNSLIADWLGNALQGEPRYLHQAMEYVVFAGGKRFRPALVYATGESLGASQCQLNSAAVAVELVHCYSLVHDDLPAMDNAAMRRGKPSCHCAFDEATAILVGDGLQSLAFEILANDQQLKVDPHYRLQMLTTLAKAIGSRGMAGGQALDLSAQGKTISVDDLTTIHSLKTGALIQASIQLGALAAGIMEVTLLKQLASFGKIIGIAFQIQDDILDVMGKAEQLGKPLHQDSKKASYVTYYGLTKAMTLTQNYFQEAEALLASLFSLPKPLADLLSLMQNRNY